MSGEIKLELTSNDFPGYYTHIHTQLGDEGWLAGRLTAPLGSATRQIIVILKKNFKKKKKGTDEQAAAAVLEMARVRKRPRPKRSVRPQPNPSLATILNARAQFPPNIPTPTKVHILTRDQC